LSKGSSSKWGGPKSKRKKSDKRPDKAAPDAERFGSAKGEEKKMETSGQTKAVKEINRGTCDQFMDDSGPGRDNRGDCYHKKS